jgi:glycosyltransferase involved in cell wall biosynthesis
MKVLLVGNYEFDGSMSMKVWAETLLRELAQCGIDVRVISPKPVFGRIRPSSNGLGKWLGYLDRFVIFPRSLRAAAAQADVVHICDHGSAMYTMKLKGKPTIVTCHDMLAVRGALGEIPDCQPSFFGQFLQRWICQGLRHARRVACVSNFTLSDARKILGRDENLRTILNGLNYHYQHLDPSEVDTRLTELPEVKAPFVLHVGSNQTRKNREGVLRIFAKAAQDTPLSLVLAGAKPDSGLTKIASELRIQDRIVEVVRPNVQTLEALYNRALVLLFPSRYEGFGWPPIEAQACGCPVVGSDIAPLVEVLGDSAALRPLADEAEMAGEIRKLFLDPEYRERMKRRGFENVSSRFQTSRMMREYLALYREVACRS